MNTRWLMRASAIYLGLLGAAATFAPQEILRLAGGEAGPVPTLLLQVGAAALVGLAVIDWMAQGVLIGGIYARPLAIGNFTHFLIAGLALIKGAGAVANPAVIIVPAAIHGGFALLFAYVAFGSPGVGKAAKSA